MVSRLAEDGFGPLQIGHVAGQHQERGIPAIAARFRGYGVLEPAGCAILLYDGNDLAVGGTVPFGFANSTQRFGRGVWRKHFIERPSDELLTGRS
ncbi:hypothetical protein FHX05_005887 [Rhizobium sp. BK491]|nr:hypothetical protein [Rhizobium sp. BK491]